MSDDVRAKALKAAQAQLERPDKLPYRSGPAPTVYVCGISWLYEIGNDAFGTKVFPPCKETLTDEHALSGCREDGVAEVEMRFVRWVVEPKE